MRCGTGQKLSCTRWVQQTCHAIAQLPGSDGRKLSSPQKRHLRRHHCHELHVDVGRQVADIELTARNIEGTAINRQSLFNNKSTRTKVVSVCAKNCSTSCALLTSQVTASGWPGTEPAEALEASSFYRVRLANSVCHPACSRPIAQALPIPCPALVTTATFVLSFMKGSGARVRRAHSPTLSAASSGVRENIEASSSTQSYGYIGVSAARRVNCKRPLNGWLR